MQSEPLDGLPLFACMSPVQLVCQEEDDISSSESTAELLRQLQANIGDADFVGIVGGAAKESESVAPANTCRVQQGANYSRWKDIVRPLFRHHEH